LDFLKASLEHKGIGYALLTGSSRNREQIIQDFRDDTQKPVFLISLKAGGVGLNLVEADYVFIADPWWNPATESQAINRAHRIGQDKRVIAYKFITKGTIEEKILKLQEQKSELVRDVIQANQRLSYQLTREDLEMLLN
jgi:SNF2 family DNA or RNA helicase